MAQAIKNVVTVRGVYVYQGIRVFPATTGRSAQVPDSPELRKLLSSGVLIEVPQSKVGAVIDSKAEAEKKAKEEAASKLKSENEAKAEAEKKSKEEAKKDKPTL